MKLSVHQSDSGRHRRRQKEGGSNVGQREISWPSKMEVSTSGSGAEALLPVQLDPDNPSTHDYNTMFYPRRKISKGSHTERRHWSELGKYLVEVSAFLNAAFGETRWLIGQAPTLATYDKSKRAHFSKSFLDEMLGFVQPNDESDKELVKAVHERVALQHRQFIESINSGTRHIIRPSERFKGGFDIIYSGLPGTASAAGTPASFPVVPTTGASVVPETKNARYTELNEAGNALALPLGQASVIMARSLLAQMFVGNKSVLSSGSAAKRVMSQLPLNFDFTKVLKTAAANVEGLGLGIELNRLVSKCPKIPAEVERGLSKYFSILVVREALPSAVKRQLADPAYDLAANYSDEAYLTGAAIGLSMVLHLPKELVEFITQTKPGNKIPLTALNTWASTWTRAAIRIPRQKMKKGEHGEGSRITLNKAPRYVLPASATAEIAGRRKTLGLYTEDGRTNSEDMFVSNIGTLNYCPKSGDMSVDNAKNYERILEEALQTSFDAGSPLAATQQGETNPVFSLASPEYKAKILKLKTDLTRYKGSMQAFSWDYNMILTTALSDPEKLNAIGLAGAARPDELSLTDYLKKPFCESMQLLFIDSKTAASEDDKAKKVTKATFGEGGSAVPMLQTSLFQNTFHTYAYLMAEKGDVVPSLQELVTEAAKDLGITNLTIGDESKVIEKNLYVGMFNNELKVVPTLESRTDPVAQMKSLKEIVGRVLKDSAGGANSNLAKLAYSKGEIPGDDPHYFDAENMTLAEFKNVYNYLGGRILYQMMRHLVQVDKKRLLVLNLENPIQFVNFSAVVKEVMPLATILSRYVPESEAIYDKAEKLAAGNTRDTSIGPSDIQVPGSKGATKGNAGFQLFPHQIEGQQYLRNDPRYAVLDVAPGGGKTIGIITDIGCLVGQSKIRRPLVLCPNGLVKNWVEDAHKVTQGKWNLIPITKDSYRLWGDERLTKMIVNAPPNTIVVVGMSVLKLDKYPIVIGNHVEMVSETLEFVKKFGFDYVAIDESHRVKNPKSATHKTAKQLCISSSVKFIRLATGTLISNNLTDIVGQTSMFNAQIFRTPEEYTAANQHQVGDTKVFVWNDGTAADARKQLSRHAAVISAKRKEWAFMLPLPIEEFISVGMTKRDHYSTGPMDPDGNVDEKAGGNAQQIMYDTVLAEVLSEIQKDSDITKLMSGHSDDDDDDDDDDDLNVDGSVGDGDLDDATLAELSQKLNPYLARLEMMLTDPLHSDVGQIYFTEENKKTFVSNLSKLHAQKNFVSNKVLKIIERIRLNFESFPWQKGKSYELRDICDVGDARYVLMPPKGAKFGTDEYAADYVSKINPADDPRWKPEPRGKVIVFCRYKSSVNCIYDNLPADLKKLAVKFHGDIKERWEYLDAFKSVPVGRTGVQILVANEMSISEGHNLQMANRLIRVESPWAPGELDQASSRIFRPDPSGKFSRENVYLDWILTDNSLEVAKMGRLISKMIVKSQFDESTNPLYASLSNFQLPLISMSLKTIGETPTLESISDYTDAYGNLVRIQAGEFAEMRATKPSTMFSVPETPIESLKGYGTIEHTPYVPNQEVPDRNNFGLFKLTDFLQDTTSDTTQEVLKDGRKLVGKYAHTEMGNGTIIKVSLGDVDKTHPNAPRKISRVHVKIEGVDDVYSSDPSMIHLATNLTAATIKEFALKTPWATKADQARAERLEQRAAARTAKETERAKKIAKKEKETLAKLKAIEKLKKTTKKVKVKPAPEPEPEVVEDNNNVEIYPVVYNGFLAIEAITEDDTIDMTPYGFTAFGEYAYAPIRDIKSFEATLNFLSSKFTISKSIMKALDDLRPAFLKKFASEEVSNLAEFKNFYRLRHTVAKVDAKTKKSELKVYPVILNNVLMLNVDLTTNPKFRRILDKPVPGTKAVQFKSTDGLDIVFLKSKSEMLAKMKEMISEGFVITNLAEFKADLKTINPKMKNI